MQKLQLARSDFGSEQPNKRAQTRRRKPQPKLRRALRRGVEIEYLLNTTEHMANCWLAAQQGAFKGLEFRLPLDEISKAEFGDALIAALGLVGHEAVLAFVPYEGSRRAVGLFYWRGMVSGEDRHIFPSVLWFPWASPRNKLEAVLKFIDEARLGDRQVLVYAPERDEKFMRHLCLYGMLKFTGRVDDYFRKGNHALHYFSRERWGL